MLGLVRRVLISGTETLLRHAEGRRDRVERADWLFWTELRAANLLADAAAKLPPSTSTQETRRSKPQGRRDA